MTEVSVNDTMTLLLILHMPSIIKTKNGKSIIAQKPNAPLIAWFIFFAAAKLPVSDQLVQLFDLLSFGAIFTWAWMEIFDGVNLFRRILGAVVVIASVTFRIFV